MYNHAGGSGVINFLNLTLTNSTVTGYQIQYKGHCFPLRYC